MTDTKLNLSNCHCGLEKNGPILIAGAKIQRKKITLHVKFGPREEAETMIPTFVHPIFGLATTTRYPGRGL